MNYFIHKNSEENEENLKFSTGTVRTKIYAMLSLKLLKIIKI